MTIDRERQPVAVLGAGLMGAGIAKVFAAKGYPVFLFDRDLDTATSATRQINGAIAHVDGGRDVDAAGSLAEAVADAAFVFESVSEKLDVKRRIFSALAECARHDAVLASNTSAIPITQIAEGLPCEARIVGSHWWNPADVVPLVEVVPGIATDAHHVEAMMQLLISVGKKAVRIDRDIPGFVGNRLQFALWREAQSLVANGVCDAETLDEIVKSSFGPRLSVLGPMENADLIGLDLTLDIMRVILPDIDNSPEPGRLLTSRVAGQHLGFKTGAGFREWTPASIQACRKRLASHLDAYFSASGTGTVGHD
uniref:3-hydroxyacyl-CoA dehydrogenase NAD-binding n=1 Tax=Caulobacter sp. (strain K31) TaxID=366602 RepID=B0T7I7_CAUSK